MKATQEIPMSQRNTFLQSQGKQPQLPQERSTWARKDLGVLWPDLSFRCWAGWPPHRTHTPLHMLISDRKFSHGVHAKWPLHHFPLPFTQLQLVVIYQNQEKTHLAALESKHFPKDSESSVLPPHRMGENYKTEVSFCFHLQT